VTGAWVRQGPRPTTGGQVEGLVDKEVVGAIKAVAPHPSDPDIVYAGSVNGGVWRTRDATSARPTWDHLTDDLPSLSIGALQFDPTDGTHATLVAGSGRFSSLARIGGALIGVLRTTDGGSTWTVHDAAGQFRAFHICDVVPRGPTIVVAANNAGIFRTTDAGTSWAPVTGAAGTGLPAGVSFALAGDPTTPTHLFAHVGTAGVFRSTDTGGSWAKVSTAAMDALLPQAVNVKISTGTADDVYVAIADGRLTGLFRSGDGGGTWTALDLPSTVEGSVGATQVRIGLHPGRQAGIHLSLTADRDDHNVVYIGGDRQPDRTEAVPTATQRFPNGIGARDYTGRIFRADAARPTGNQASHITHSHTASGTAPHADSRSMAIDARGDLIEGDDGGIYRRRNPRSDTADWVSMIGDLQSTEFHSGAWDANTGTAMGGAQDTGTPQELAAAAPRWPSVSTGDGAVVLVDDTTTPGLSVRYSSFQNLGAFRREVYDSGGVLQSRVFIPMQVLGPGAAVAAQFYTPLELNQVVATRLVIGAANGVYESDDQGDTVTAIGPGIQVNGVNAGLAAPIAYGAQGNADLLYVGSGTSLFVRTAPPPAPLGVSPGYPGTSPVRGIAVLPTDPDTAFTVDAGAVHRTTNAGLTWTNVTGNLLTLGGVVLRSVTYCADHDGGSVVVGTNAGVFSAPAAATGSSWAQLGSGLPTVPVPRLRYSPASRVLLAATLGRGAWTLRIP
jgi:photosystem II stability/assembly factor-like uncharacterized protein